MRWIFATPLLFALSACANMDAAECRTADWRAIGYEDGAQGQSPGFFGKRRKACADHGVTADFEAYLAGREEGLAQFCDAYNGYRLGTRGYRYRGICPARLEAAFLAAHAEGYGLYQRQATLKRIGKRLRSKRKRSQDIERLLAEKTALLISPESGLEQRATLAVELKQLAEEKVRLERLIRDLEYDHADAEQEYESYEHRVSSRRRG